MPSCRLLNLICLLLLIFPDLCHTFLYIKSQLDQCKHQWLHPPKTGSTFCLTIQHACNETDFVSKAAKAKRTLGTYKGCAKLLPHHLSTYRGTRWHHPLMKGDFDNLASFVTVLREPRTRAVSSFCNYMHTDGMKKHEAMRVQAMIAERNISNSPTACQDTFNDYLSWPNSHGCYTKMLNGHGCHANMTLTNEMVHSAISNLKKFSFVGILEDYSKSVDLFLAMNKQNVTRGALRVEKMKVRPGHTNTECVPAQDGVNFCLNTDMTIISRNFKDDYDQQVYEYAKQRFYSDLSKYRSNLLS